MIDYGVKGCRCFRDQVDVSRNGRVEHIPGRWLPNAACPHHGLLADFTERMETGQYTVISKPVTIEPRQEITAPGEPMAYTPDWPCGGPCGANPMDCPGPAADGACLSPTTEEERQRGLRAAVRRARAWFRRRYHLPRLDEHGYCTRCD